MSCQWLCLWRPRWQVGWQMTICSSKLTLWYCSIVLVNLQILFRQHHATATINTSETLGVSAVHRNLPWCPSVMTRSVIWGSTSATSMWQCMMSVLLSSQDKYVCVRISFICELITVLTWAFGGSVHYQFCLSVNNIIARWGKQKTKHTNTHTFLLQKAWL